MVLHCWKHFDQNFTREEKTANSDEGPGYINAAWYSDMRDTDHIMSEREVHEPRTNP
jgi:hypothetical protein